MELKGLHRKRKGCAGGGCQLLGGEESPKSMDEPIYLQKRGRKAPAIQGSSAWGGRCATRNGLSLGPLSAVTDWFLLHPVMHPGPGASCVALTSLAE